MVPVLEDNTVTANNRGDGDKSREQSGNNVVMGLRIIGNTVGIQLINVMVMASRDGPNVRL